MTPQQPKLGENQRCAFVQTQQEDFRISSSNPHEVEASSNANPDISLDGEERKSEDGREQV